MVLVDRDVYVNHMENILRDKSKFEKIDVKSRTLNFHFKNFLGLLILQVVLVINNIRELKWLDLDLVFCMAFVKFTKAIVDVCLSFRPILSAIGTCL